MSDTRTVYLVEDFSTNDLYNLGLESIGSEQYETLAEAKSNVRGKHAPVIFEWTMFGEDRPEGFTVERDDFRYVWCSLAYNQAQKRMRTTLWWG